MKNNPPTDKLRERFEEEFANLYSINGAKKLYAQDDVWKFIQQAIKQEGIKQYDAGYRKGVKDEVECIEISGEHGKAVKKIRKQERSRVVEEIRTDTNKLLKEISELMANWEKTSSAYHFCSKFRKKIKSNYYKYLNSLTQTSKNGK